MIQTSDFSISDNLTAHQLLQIAKELLKKREYSLALQHLDQIISNGDYELQNPDHGSHLNFADVHYNRGVAFLHFQGGHQEALLAFDESLRLNPNFASAHFGRGESLRFLRRYTEALVAYDKSLELNPKSAGAYSGRGVALRFLGRHQEALVAFNKSLKLNPRSVDAFFGGEECLRLLGHYTEALASCNALLQSNPNFADAHFRRGESLRFLHNYEEALVAYDKSLALNLKSASVHFGRGESLRFLRRYTEALVACNESLQLNPNFAEAYCEQGKALRFLGRHQEALVAFNKSLKLNPRSVDAFFGREECLRLLGHYTEALASCNALLQSNPNFADAHFRRGESLRFLHNYEEALVAYDKSLALNLKSASVHFGRGECLRLLGRYPEALTACNESLQLNPNFAEAYCEQGEALRFLGRHHEALVAYDKSLVLNLKSASVHFGRGECLRLLGRHQEALAASNESIRLNLKFAGAYWEREEALSFMDHYKEELDISLEELNTSFQVKVVFDEEQCLEKFREIFDAVVMCETNVLDLSNKNVQDNELSVIVRFLNGHPKITTLNLNNNKIGPNGAKILGTNKTIKILNLNSNKIGDEGAIVVAKMNLTVLEVMNNGIADNGAHALAFNETIEALRLNSNNIKDNGAQALVGNQKIKVLELNSNSGFNQDTLMAFAKNTTLKKLRLCDNSIEDIGAMILSLNNSIDDLDLECNKVGDMGALALAINPYLTRLVLKDNLVGSVGKEALRKNRALNELDLDMVDDNARNNNIQVKTKHLNEGVRFFCAAAERNLAQAQLCLGQLYEKGGYGLDQNYTEAARLYGLALVHDKKCSFEATAQKAMDLLQALYENQPYITKLLNENREGYYVAAQYGLGQIYAIRGKMSQDIEINNKGNRLLHAALEQGYAPAQYWLSQELYNPQGDPGNNVKAFELCVLAGIQGYKGAEYCLGWMYEESNSLIKISKSDVKAVFWYRRAAAKNVADAQAALGDFYQMGRGGLEKDNIKAIRCYRQSIEQGYAQAHFSLAVLYCKSFKELNPNYSEVLNLFRFAESNGVGEASYYINDIFTPPAKTNQEIEARIISLPQRTRFGGIVTYDFAKTILDGELNKAIERGNKVAQEEEKKKGKAEQLASLTTKKEQKNKKKNQEKTEVSPQKTEAIEKNPPFFDRIVEMINYLERMQLEKILNFSKKMRQLEEEIFKNISSINMKLANHLVTSAHEERRLPFLKQNNESIDEFKNIAVKIKVHKTNLLSTINQLLHLCKGVKKRLSNHLSEADRATLEKELNTKNPIDDEKKPESNIAWNTFLVLESALMKANNIEEKNAAIDAAWLYLTAEKSSIEAQCTTFNDLVDTLDNQEKIIQVRIGKISRYKPMQVNKTIMIQEISKEQEIKDIIEMINAKIIQLKIEILNSAPQSKAVLEAKTESESKVAFDSVQSLRQPFSIYNKQKKQPSAVNETFSEHLFKAIAENFSKDKSTAETSAKFQPHNDSRKDRIAAYKAEQHAKKIEEQWQKEKAAIDFAREIAEQESAAGRFPRPSAGGREISEDKIVVEQSALLKIKLEQLHVIIEATSDNQWTQQKLYALLCVFAQVNELVFKENKDYSIAMVAQQLRNAIFKKSEKFLECVNVNELVKMVRDWIQFLQQKILGFFVDEEAVLEIFGAHSNVLQLTYELGKKVDDAPRIDKSKMLIKKMAAYWIASKKVPEIKDPVISNAAKEFCLAIMGAELAILRDGGELWYFNEVESLRPFFLEIITRGIFVRHCGMVLTTKQQNLLLTILPKTASDEKVMPDPQPADTSKTLLFYKITSPLNYPHLEAKTEADAEVNIVYEYEDNDIQAILKERLGELRKTYCTPALFRTYVFGAADDIAPQQLQNRLIYAKQTKIGERTVLIPCNLGNGHWVGICIKFNCDNVLCEALYVDSLNVDSNVPEGLQTQFQEVFPDNLLSVRSAMHQDDKRSCGAYVIENLLLLAQNLKKQNLNSKAIRQLHLDTLKKNNPSFYILFYEKQKYNVPTTERFHKQIPSIEGHDKIRFSKYELDRIYKICEYLLSFKMLQLKQALLASFKENEKNLSDVESYRDGIRRALKQAADQLGDIYSSSDSEDRQLLASLSQLMFCHAKNGDGKVDITQAKFAIGYEEIRAISKNIFIDKADILLAHGELKKIIEQDEALAVQLQVELLNEEFLRPDCTNRL